MEIWPCNARLRAHTQPVHACDLQHVELRQGLQGLELSIYCVWTAQTQYMLNSTR